MEEFTPTNPGPPEPTPEPSPEPSRIRNVRVLVLAVFALLGTVVVVLFTFLPPRNDLLRTQLVGPGGDGGIPPGGEEPTTEEGFGLFSPQDWDNPAFSLTTNVSIEEEEMCLPTASPDSLGISPLGPDAHAQTEITCGNVGTTKFSPYRLEGFDTYKSIPVNVTSSTDAKEIRRAMCNGSLSACRIGKDGKPTPSNDPVFFVEGQTTSGCTFMPTVAPQGFTYHALMTKAEHNPPGTDTWTFIRGEAPHCANTPARVEVPPIYPASGCPKTGIQPTSEGTVRYKSISDAQKNIIAEQLGDEALQKMFRFIDAVVTHEKRHMAINTAFFTHVQEITNNVIVPAGSMVAVAAGKSPNEKVDEIVFPRVQTRIKEAEKFRDDQQKAWDVVEDKDSSALSQAFCDLCRDFFQRCKTVPAPPPTVPKP